MATNVLNFLLIALYHPTYRSTPAVVERQVALPDDAAIGGRDRALTAAVAYGYVRLGIGAVALAAVVLVVFQYLVWARVQAYERGEELAKRTRELASLQVGLLSTVMQTLSMRDAMTARHSAAVARYAREVAQLLGMSERDQDLVHTAALLHDIGKFIFPDSILLADRKLTDEEWEIVKLHPEQGAKLVRRIEGYGPVADIIIGHHERVDGKGYPHGVAGEEIPLGSRIISVADTYDVMTSRDSYRRPVSSEAAIVELRRVAGSQLDAKVVEVFVEMIEAGRVAFRHADEADFERELAFERRVADYAPRRGIALASTTVPSSTSSVRRVFDQPRHTAMVLNENERLKALVSTITSGAFTCANPWFPPSPPFAAATADGVFASVTVSNLGGARAGRHRTCVQRMASEV